VSIWDAAAPKSGQLKADPPGPLYKRLLWMLAICSASVLTLAIVAMLIRTLIEH